MVLRREIDKAAQLTPKIRRVMPINRVGHNANKRKAAIPGPKYVQESKDAIAAAIQHAPTVPGYNHGHADGYERGQRDGVVQGYLLYAKQLEEVLGVEHNENDEVSEAQFNEIVGDSDASAFHADVGFHQPVQHDDADLPAYDFDTQHAESFQALKQVMQEHIDIVYKSDIAADKKLACRDKLLQFLSGKMHCLTCTV